MLRTLQKVAATAKLQANVACQSQLCPTTSSATEGTCSLSRQSISQIRFNRVHSNNHNSQRSTHTLLVWATRRPQVRATIVCYSRPSMTSLAKAVGTPELQFCMQQFCGFAKPCAPVYASACLLSMWAPAVPSQQLKPSAACMPCWQWLLSGVSPAAAAAPPVGCAVACWADPCTREAPLDRSKDVQAVYAAGSCHREAACLRPSQAGDVHSVLFAHVM